VIEFLTSQAHRQRVPSTVNVSRNKVIARSAVLAVPYAILRLIPFAQLVGAPGVLPVSYSLTLLYVLLQGPWGAALSVLLGTFVSFALGQPPFFLGLDFVTPVCAVTVTGLLAQRRHQWTILLAFLALLTLFNISPMTTPFVPVPALGISLPFSWLHTVALVVLVAYIIKGKGPLKASSSTRDLLTKGTAVTFVGLLFQQLVGSYFLFELLLGTLAKAIDPSSWPAIWTLSSYVYPLEWLSLTALAVALAVPALRAGADRYALER